jgi:hypothetical protein
MSEDEFVVVVRKAGWGVVHRADCHKALQAKAALLWTPYDADNQDRACSACLRTLPTPDPASRRASAGGEQ